MARPVKRQKLNSEMQTEYTLNPPTSPYPTIPPVSGLCIFFKLPRELRDHIYELAFTEENGLVYGSDGATGRSKFYATTDQQDNACEANQLKFVCRQLYWETVCLEVRYNKLTFPVTWELQGGLEESSGLSKEIPFDRLIDMRSLQFRDEKKYDAYTNLSNLTTGAVNFVRFLSRCAPSQQTRLGTIVIHELGGNRERSLYHWKDLVTGVGRHQEVYDFCKTHPTCKVVVHYNWFKGGLASLKHMAALQNCLRGPLDAPRPIESSETRVVHSLERWIRTCLGPTFLESRERLLCNLRMSILLQAPTDAPESKSLGISSEKAIERVNYMQKWFEHGF